MKSIFLHTKITILFLCCLLGGIGCQQHGPQAQEGKPLSLTPSFAATATGKASEIGFQVGDQVGLYATHESRILDPAGNLIENALMEAVDQSGVLTLQGNPTRYYPSTKDGVRLYAYRPYQTTIDSPRALAVSVAFDQQQHAQYIASDWCWGTLATTPNVAATPILFHHRTAQVNVAPTLPLSGKIGHKTIDKVTGAALHGVYRGGSWDLSNGGWSDLSNVGDVSPYRPDGLAARFLTLLPPQTIEGGKVFASITVQYTDATSETFDFTPSDPIEFKMGVSTTLAITLNDQGTVALGAVQVDDWVETGSNGEIIDPVSNFFTLHWRLPHQYFDRVSRVELVLDRPEGGTMAVEAKDVQVVAGSNKTASSYTFNVALDQSSGIAYTYRIQAVRFYDGADLLQESTSVLGTNVYRSGPYTIGVEQDRLLAVRSGTISDWNELLYGDRLKGVDNTFDIQLIEYPSYASVGAVRLTIDGQPYTFNNVTAVAGSHAMLSQTTTFRFPDANGKAPYKYPFVVERVALLDGSGAVLGDGSYGCAIRVSRAGQISMQLYRGVLSALATTVTGYSSSSVVGRPEYGGAVTSNPIRVVYCDGRQQAACSSVARVDVTIGGKEVALTGYVMDGTRFAAQSRAPHVDIVAGGASRPVSYPYEITAVKFKKADGSLLAAASFADPLVVNWWGEVSIELMTNMDDAPHVVHPPSPWEYVEVGGLRWATGNLVAVDNHNCRVGAPADGGVYFQFGSLIGWKGGAAANGGTGVGIPNKADGTFWGGSFSWASEAMVWPDNLVGTKTTWVNKDGSNVSTLDDYYFNYSVAPWNAMEQDIRDFAIHISGDSGSGTLATGRYATKGVGDPCTYYLGDPWRLPTSGELKTMCNNQGGYNNQIAWASCGASWVTSPVNGGNFASNQLFFPVSGYRVSANSSFSSVVVEGGTGYARSSSIYDYNNSLTMAFRIANVLPQGLNQRAHGMPVRCVADAPKRVNTPTADDYVEVDMGAGKKLKWAKGNLIAADGHGCKVGAPSDGGLYFQFGSLIGWKGGSLANGGNGKGMPDAAWNGKFWNGATVWSWNNSVIVTPTELATKPTAWPNNNAENISTLTDYYFNYSKSPYETQSQSIRDYPGLASGALADQGIGDACSYYLGGTWRLPTGEEYKALCNNRGNPEEPLSFAEAQVWLGTYNGAQGAYALSNRLFFPAAGWLHPFIGNFSQINFNCNSFSSSIGSYKSSMPFSATPTAVYAQGGSTRSAGFVARCVSE